MKKFFISILFVILAESAFALNVVFRYDDYVLKDDTFQNALVDVFVRQEVPLCIGIIPCKNDSALSYLYEEGSYLDPLIRYVQEGTIDVALHGCRHKGAINIGELYKMSYEEQKRLLSRGSAHLDSVFGIHVHAFFPPWNRYDTITLRVLEELGFNAISAELNEPHLFSNPHFQYYPMTIDHPRNLMQEVEWNAKHDALVVCMFHRYDFTEAYTLGDLENLIIAIKNHPEHPQIVSIDHISKTDSSFTGSRMVANMHKPLSSKFRKTRHVLMTEREMKYERVLNISLYALILFGLAIASMCVMNNKRWYFIAQCVCICALLLAVWETWLTTRVSGLLGLGMVIGIAIVYWIIERVRNAR